MSIESTATDATRAPFHGEDATILPAPTTTLARLLAMVGSNKSVLELGGDAESLSRLLAASGCRVVSVQPHQEGRDRTEPHCERVIVGDVELLDLERETAIARFDVVLAPDLLTRVKDPGALLRKIARLLQPCGCVVAAVPNVAHVSVRLSVLAGRSPYDGEVTSPSHLRFYTREILTRLFDDAGFAIARLERQQETVASAGPDPGAFVMPDLVKALREDADARTSHFIVAAYHLPSPAGGTLRIAVNELREHCEELEVGVAAGARTIEELRMEVSRYQRAIEQHEDAVRGLNAQALRRDEIVQSLSLQLDQHRAELSRMTGLLEQSRAELRATAAELDRLRLDVTAATDRVERERGAVASVRETACRVAAEAAALRDARSLRVARWLRGDPDLWERVPAGLAALKRDAIQYGFRSKGYALRESVNLQSGHIIYPFPVRLNGVRGVALQVAVPAPGCGGVIGAELISPSNDVVTRGTVSLDLVSDQMPTVIQFAPTDVVGEGWALGVFVEDSPSPVRVLELQRCRLPIQSALVRRPFCSIVV
jgi:O-antigen biosynthesis protein